MILESTYNIKLTAVMCTSGGGAGSRGMDPSLSLSWGKSSTTRVKQTSFRTKSKFVMGKSQWKITKALDSASTKEKLQYIKNYQLLTKENMG